MNKQAAIDNLTALIERVPHLLTRPKFSDEFQQWQVEAAAALKHIFPKEASYLKEWNDIPYSLAVAWSGMPPDASDNAFKGGLRTAKSYLAAKLEEVKLYWPEPVVLTPTPITAPMNPNQVFVIHGRQKLADVHNFLRALGLEPLEWSEARKMTKIPNPYTWQIVDTALKTAGAIVVLFTPDDEARLREDLWAAHEDAWEKGYMHQPRQNVLFEAGVAYGRNPDRTVMIRVGHSHRPISDLAGHHVLKLTDEASSRKEVADALQNAGCPVKTSGADWMKAGEFG